MALRRVLTDSPFDTLEKTFDLLVTGPNPLALDGTSLDGLPDRVIPLGELKAMLLHPSMAFAARDAVVDELVSRSRSHGGAWTVGLAGMLLPGLRRAVWPLVQACPGKAADIEGPRHSSRSWSPWPAASRAERASRPGCAGWRASAPIGCCAPRWPSAPGRAQIRSPPPRADRGDTPTSCWSGPCGPGSSAHPTPS